jgi:prevent-host-death family protein
MRKIKRKGVEKARSELPRLLDAAESGVSTIITRHGKPIAALVPLSKAGREERQRPITSLAGSGRGLWGKDSRRTIKRLRDEWDR